MKVLVIISDSPYGNQKAYDAFRLAMMLQLEHPEVEMRVFLMSDGVTCALPNQQTPEGYYNIESMLNSVVSKGGLVRALAISAEARGVRELPLAKGVEVGTMDTLATWTLEADRIITI